MSLGAWFLVLGAWILRWVGAWKLGGWGFGICAMHYVLCAVSYAILEMCVGFRHILLCAICYVLCTIWYAQRKVYVIHLFLRHIWKGAWVFH